MVWPLAVAESSTSPAYDNTQVLLLAVVIDQDQFAPVVDLGVDQS